MSTIVQFDIIRPTDGPPYMDHRSIYIRGWMNFHMLTSFLYDEKEISTLLLRCEGDVITLEIWEDTDDHTTWLDYNILDPDFDPESKADWRNLKILKLLN